MPVIPEEPCTSRGVRRSTVLEAQSVRYFGSHEHTG